MYIHSQLTKWNHSIILHQVQRNFFIFCCAHKFSDQYFLRLFRTENESKKSIRLVFWFFIKPRKHPRTSTYFCIALGKFQALLDMSIFLYVELLRLNKCKFHYNWYHFFFMLDTILNQSYFHAELRENMTDGDIILFLKEFLKSFMILS